ncbi:MAG: transposase [Deltaproteobacteria bacterium]|nr:transposase [Deltaproteobacteria bacterium]
MVVHYITRGNEHDSRVLCRIAPYLKGSSVYADKGYCSHKVEEELRKYGCRSYIIKRNNMKSKDFNRDREISRKRSPFERVFAVLPKVTRFRTLLKNKIIGYFQALAYNIRVMFNRIKPTYSTT